MSVTISICFLTGRAHLHPWQTHHSEGRVEWPPSQWRLLRALVAVAGRGLTSLPQPDFVVDARKKATATKKNPNPVWPPEGYRSLPDDRSGQSADEIPLSRLAELLHALSAVPTIWVPKTSGGHTRQYFPIHSGGMVKNTGSAVFDTFATVRKDQPLLFYWPELALDDQQRADLKLLLGRMTYFGRAESWCQAEAHTCFPEEIGSEGISAIVAAETHWECVCIEDAGRPIGREYRDYLLERRLAPVAKLKQETVDLLPRTIASDGKKRKVGDADALRSLLEAESKGELLLRCLLRESGQDIKDGLERPIGTRWIHYAVPRAVYDVPRARIQHRPRFPERVNLVRYALNTATVNRPVLPPVTDALLIADKFRSAAMALCRERSQSLSGHEADGSPCKGHQHAFWWPLDEDDDGFIDHVMAWAPGGFCQGERDALRRLTRLRQRGGRPDLLVTPVYVGQEDSFRQWLATATTFISFSPYFCPIQLSHGKSRGSSRRSLRAAVVRGLVEQQIIGSADELDAVDEVVYDYAPGELALTAAAVDRGEKLEPMPPRQFFPLIDPPGVFPRMPRLDDSAPLRLYSALLKDPDEGYPFGVSIGRFVDHGARFIRAMAFCRRRRSREIKGMGRMLKIIFRKPRTCRPFSIGAECHYGLGLFLPAADGDK